MSRVRVGSSEEASKQEERLQFLPEDPAVAASRDAADTKLGLGGWEKDALSVLRHLTRPVLHGITLDEFVYW